jgi:hypothetical protein
MEPGELYWTLLEPQWERGEHLQMGEKFSLGNMRSPAGVLP